MTSCFPDLEKHLVKPLGWSPFFLFQVLITSVPVSSPQSSPTTRLFAFTHSLTHLRQFLGPEYFPFLLMGLNWVEPSDFLPRGVGWLLVWCHQVFANIIKINYLVYKNLNMFNFNKNNNLIERNYFIVILLKHCLNILHHWHQLKEFDGLIKSHFQSLWDEIVPLLSGGFELPFAIPTRISYQLVKWLSPSEIFHRQSIRTIRDQPEILNTP